MARKLIVGVTDLATTHPDLAKEWDYEKNILKPTEILSGCNKKVFWVCSKGHSWQVTPNSRTNNGNGCPYCAGQKAITGQTDLVTTHPDLVKEWDFTKNTIKPTEVTKGSCKKVWWLCKNGHSWQASPNSRTDIKSGCPYCAGHKAIIGQTDLVTTNPDLVKEWDFEKNDLKPTEISHGSKLKVWWLCKNGHSWQARIANRVKGKGCPYCSGKKVLEMHNDLQTTHPDLVKEWDFDKNIIKPTEVPVGSSKKVWWICENNHSWQATVSSRTYNKTGCPYCSGRKAIIGKTDLQTTHPELVKEWDFSKNIIKPTEVSLGSRTKVWWKCKNGHSWQVAVNNRTNMKSGCPCCSGHKAITGETDLATMHPDLIKEWDYEKNVINPSEIKSKSSKKVWWLCKNGHSWQAVVYSRTQGRGCPICNGSKSERMTVDILQELSIKFEREWVQRLGINNRRYDFYLSDIKLCIEIDGLQHFEESAGQFKGKYTITKTADTQKNNYLLKQGIILLRIPGLDVFNVRLQEVNQPTLDESQFKLLLTDIIKSFITTRQIPDSILNIYKDDSETNYYQVALQMNELS